MKPRKGEGGGEDEPPLSGPEVGGKTGGDSTLYLRGATHTRPRLGDLRNWGKREGKKKGGRRTGKGQKTFSIIISLRKKRFYHGRRDSSTFAKKEAERKEILSYPGLWKEKEVSPRPGGVKGKKRYGSQEKEERGEQAEGNVKEKESYHFISLRRKKKWFPDYFRGPASSAGGGKKTVARRAPLTEGLGGTR